MKRVLIVDDSELIRKTYLFTLRKSYRCDLAENGEQALALYTQALDQGDPFRFVLTDLSMPAMAGEAAVRAMRQAEEDRRVADGDRAVVLVLSCTGDHPGCQRAMADCRVAAFLTKPVLPGDLLSALLCLG